MASVLPASTRPAALSKLADTSEILRRCIESHGRDRCSRRGFQGGSSLVSAVWHGNFLRCSGRIGGCSQLKPSIDLLTFVNGTQDHFDSRGKVPFDFKSDEQRQVALDTLANRDQVYAIRGRAGADKTTKLREIRKGLEKAATAVGQPSAKPPEELSLPSFPASAGWCSTTGFALPRFPRMPRSSSWLTPAGWSFCPAGSFAPSLRML